MTLDLRVLFEKILATMPKEKTGEIWNMYLKFEYVCGNLNTIHKIEQRRAQTMPNFGKSLILTSKRELTMLQTRVVSSVPCNDINFMTCGLVAVTRWRRSWVD